MSFGFSIGDFIAVAQLASNVVSGARRACGVHDDFTRELTSLHIVLRHLEREVVKPNSILKSDHAERKAELATLVAHCYKVLEVKSRIAIEYCYKFREANPSAHIPWVHGTNKARFEADYKNIARKLKIPRFDDPEIDKLTLVSEWLSDDVSTTWLLVLDNVDDSKLWAQEPASEQKVHPSIPLIQFVPRGRRGPVLFTTRDAHLGKQLVGVKKNLITVLPLKSSEACFLLHSKIGENDNISQSDAVDIVQTLDYLPLAITQAAAYLEQTNMTVAEYLKLLRNGKTDTFDLLKEGIRDFTRDHEIQNSVFQTWKLSFQQISKQSPRAADILSLMALLDRHAIPVIFLRQDGEPEFNFIDAIQKLRAFYLISEETKGSVFSIHRLVQLSVQKWLDHLNELPRWQNTALLTVSSHCPLEFWYADENIRKALHPIIPHMEMVLQYKFEDMGCLLTRAPLLSFSGHYNFGQKKFEVATIQSSEAISIRERYLGPNHVRSLHALVILGVGYWRQGKSADAELILQNMLIHEDMLGLEKTQNIMTTLGAVYYDQGRLGDAVAMYQRVLTRRGKSAKPLDVKILTTLNNIANVYRRQGRLEDAEGLLKEVLIGRNLIYGEKHPTTFKRLMNLAYVYRTQGRHSEMEKMFREALERSEKSLGSKDKNTLAAAYELYYFYTQQGTVPDQALLQKVELLKREPGPPVNLFCDFC
ncbi:hypothetical protein G7Y89_g7861 [Cudoniella acicularis]|uniref:Uncharacterized protein n=1 Tax=Cudoniella acicularis TaxID=354080 RepID=A0A8H4W1K4_9HELO|nr:hypothetical protein G7Y89_g7861 [Cudoniella acicularis]